MGIECHIEHAAITNAIAASYLDDTLSHHGFGHLEETSHIGTTYIVDIAIRLCAILHAVLMNVAHDHLQTLVNLLTRPAQTF